MFRGRLRRALHTLAKGFATRSAYKFWLKDWISLNDLSHLSDALKSIRFSRNLEPLILESPATERILVIAPHPDDESIGIGGTLAKFCARGGKPTVVFLTSGEPRERSIRIAEATEACRELAATPVFLGYLPERIPIDKEAIDRIAELLALTNPEALFLPFFGDDHDDHRRANQLLREAARSTPRGPRPEIWAYQVYSVIPGNVIVDITEQKDAKAHTIAHYKSQMRRRDWVNFALGLNAFNSRLLPGALGPRWAETFFVLPFEDYMSLLDHYFVDEKNCYYSSFYLNQEGLES